MIQRSVTRSFRLALILAMLAGSLALATSAFAADGDSEQNATDLAPYLGSSFTAALFSPAMAPTGYYYLKVLIPAGSTLSADFEALGDTVNLKAIVFYGDYPDSDPVTDKIAHLSFTAPVTSMYTVYAATSSPGTFTVRAAKITQLTGSSGTRVTNYAAATTVYANLRAGTETLSGKPVHLFYSSNGKTGWTASSSAVSEAVPGRFSASVRRTSTMYYRFRYSGDSTCGPSWGPVVKVYPRVRLTRTTSWSVLHPNKAYYAKGYIQPYHATSNSNKVKILAYKKGSGGVYRYVKSFTASYIRYSSTKTAYKAKVILTSRGTWKLVARHYKDTSNYTTYGSTDFVTVK